MSFILGALNASYTRSELLSSVKDHYNSLLKADKEGLDFNLAGCDLHVADSVEEEKTICLNNIPGLTTKTSVNAQVEPGIWKNSFFTVTRQLEGDITVQQAEFPTVLSPFGIIEVTELRMSPGHLGHPACTSVRLGATDLSRKFTTDSFPGDADYPQSKVNQMLDRAQSLMPEGKLDFLKAPTTFYQHPTGWTSCPY